MITLDSLQRFYATVSGVVALFAVLVRVAYLLGKILEAFRKHVADSDRSFADHESRLRGLERGRHR